MSEPAESIVLVSGAMTDAGLQREVNEDAVYAGRRLFAVADGFGSLGLGGDVASATVIDVLKPLDEQSSAGDLIDELSSRIEAADHMLRSLCGGSSSAAGATLTAMLWSGWEFALAHIGDTRAYLLRDQVLFHITKDHTLAQLKVDMGELTDEEAAASKDRFLLVRCLPGRAEPAPDLSRREARSGDRYLLCTDGLLMLDAQSIHGILTTVEDPNAAATELVKRANAAGGMDNIGCVVVDVLQSALHPRAPRPKPAL
jgi:PPM family protein phosphatase